MSRNNKFKKALKHLKNTSIDERLELVEALPVNNTTGIYVDVPGKDVEEITPAEIDSALDLDEDGDGELGYNGTDTTGLFTEDGTIRSIEPPGDRSYILGPMISMWYAWANYTQIGYVRQADRKMVNLGRIVGELDNWDGETGFTGYGQMSIEQAVWYKEQGRQDYRAFYPGPPSNPADEYGRYIGSIISGSKNDRTGVRDVWEPGTNRSSNPTDDLALLLKNKEINDKNRSDEITRMVLNAAMLGLDIAAVVALLFPEPGSSLAGAAHLASKFRYIAKLRRFRGALNPFGQRAVRSGAAGRVRRQVYSGRPYQGTRGFGKTTYGTTNRATARTYSNPGPLKGTPGTGSRVNPRGTVDTGTLPQRYIDKYGSRSVLGQKQVKLGPKAAKRTFGEQPEFILEQINNYLLLETAATGSGLGGGMEIADGYVDKVSETSSPEQLEKASNDANDIAKEGGRGLSDSDLAKIDKDAEAEAKRLTNFDVSNPESMDDDQLSASTEMMYEIDPDWLIESFDRNESLIDTVKLDKLYNTYSERRSYIGSLEHGFSISPEFKRYYNQAEYLYNTYVTQIEFGRDVNGYPKFINKNTGESMGQDDFLKQKLTEWSDLFTKTWDTFNSKTVRDRVNKDREENDNNYRKQSDILFRPFYLQIVREWSQRGADVNDDPFAIKDYINQQGGIQNMSEADKKKLLKFLQKSGISYGEVAALPLVAIPLLANPAVQAAIAAGGVALTYELQKRGAGQAVVNAIVDAVMPGDMDAGQLDPDGSLGAKDDFGGSVKDKDMPGLTPAGKLAGKHAKEKAAADKEVQDAIDQYGEGSDENVEALQKRNDTYGRHKQEKKNLKNKKESYEPKFLKNRERKNLTEIVTPKQKRILRDIKKPVQVKEMPTKFKVNPTGRKYKNKDVGAGMMKIPDTPAAYKPQTNIWQKKDYAANVRASQEKKNEVLELVGAAEHHWTYLTEDRRKKKQEEMNERLSIEFDNQLEMMYEKHKIKEAKITKAMSAFKKSNDIKPEYPENPPPELDPNTGMHPKYGKHYKHNKLDPQSAEAMPPTGDPEIDANIEKATNQKEKSRKLKILLGKRKGA